MTLAPVLTGCHVCRHPQVDLINRRMKEGVPVLAIVRWMNDEKITPAFHRNTLMRHRRDHLTDDYERQRGHAVAVLKQQAATIQPTATTDIARLIRDVAAQRVMAGEVKPTISEGLRAQDLLDKRAGKMLDVQVALTIAQAMFGGVVEGEYQEIAAPLN